METREQIVEQANEAAAIKAAELSKSLNTLVHPIVFVINENEPPVVGFVREPSRASKMQVMDRAMQGVFTAASSVLDAYLIKEESDARISSFAPENDKYYLGAVQATQSLITIAVDLFKKK
jgi:hypothetical protein